MKHIEEQIAWLNRSGAPAEEIAIAVTMQAMLDDHKAMQEALEDIDDHDDGYYRTAAYIATKCLDNLKVVNDPQTTK